MFSKKFLSGLLCFAMLFGLCLPTSAFEITETTSRETIVTYGMSESFLVVIPGDFVIDSNGTATADVEAHNVIIADGSVLGVVISGNDYINKWELIDTAEATNKLTYTIGTTEGASDIIDGSVVLSVAAGEAYDSAVTETMYFTVVDDLSKSGTYTDTLTFTVEIFGQEIDDLEKIYEFNYYSTINEALAEINGNTIGENETGIKGEASVAIYTDNNGKINLVLFENVSTSERITPTKDMVLNLNGNTLTGTNLIAIDTSADYPVTITVDGRTAGSTIQTIQTGTNQARAIQVRTGSTVNVLGGTYISEAASGAAVTIYTMATGTLNISDAVIMSESASAAATGISISAGSSVNISNCDITTTAKNNVSIGINNSGETTVSDCSIEAYSDLNTSKNRLAKGIDNLESGKLLVENCYVLGTHSGVQNVGVLFVDGGTYESVGHGGFYLAGTNTTVYIKNAISRECSIPSGYTSNVENGGGLYVGGAEGMDNNTVYIDNCQFYGSKSPFVLRDTANEKNNTIYISNSTINTDKKIRIDNDTHKLYIGVGNNFTADNTTRPEMAIETDEVYRFE